MRLIPMWSILAAGGILAASSPAQTSIFNIVASPSPNPHGNTLLAVTAFAANNAWAVGYKGSNFPTNGTGTLIEHFNGTSWNVAPSPNPAHATSSCPAGETANVLTAVAGTSATDIWAVGSFFDCATLIEYEPLILHWNGTQWKVSQASILSTLGSNALNGVVAFSPSNAYAVGYQVNPANSGTLTLVEHWDGTKWSVMTTPNANQNGNVLTAVTATSPTDIWAVGTLTDQATTSIQTLIEHFDGVQWSIVPSPSPVIGFLDQNVLTSVVAVSPANATAVGYILNGNALNSVTLVEHWDGAQWRVVRSPNVSTAAGDSNHLNAVTMVSPMDVYAVGWFGDAATNGQHKTLVEHFDGSKWIIISSPTKPLAQELNGVSALPGTSDVWSVGAFSPNGIDFEFGELSLPETLVLFTPGG